ncbi:hypothetical protein RFI_34494, partial [Reticulomyxa filosa]
MNVLFLQGLSPQSVQMVKPQIKKMVLQEQSHWTMRNELTTKKKIQTTHWMSEDFENMYIESLTRISKLLQMSKQKRAPVLFDEILSMKQKYLVISTLQQKVMDKQHDFDIHKSLQESIAFPESLYTSSAKSNVQLFIST